MTTENKRDLHADLAICDAATPGPWKVGRQSPNGLQNVGTKQGLMITQTFEIGDAALIAEAREGWPEAIRRAIEAEAEVERLERAVNGLKIDKRNLYMIADERCARACQYATEIERLREILMDVYQKARNDVARWDGGQCVGTQVFSDRMFTRGLVRDIELVLFPREALRK